MKLLSRFLGGLLALVLAATAGAWVLGQALVDEHYLVRRAADAQIADQLADGLPAALAALTSTPEDTRVILAQAVTPAFVRDQLETVLPQLVRYYAQNGAVPQVDLRDLAVRIRGEGFAVPPALEPTLATPQSVTAGRLDGTLRAVAHTSSQLVWLGPLAAAGLTGLILLVARQRRWLVLAGAAMGGALGVLILAALAYVPPPLIASTLTTSPARALAPAVRSLAEAVARDQSHRLLWVAAGLAGAAALLCVIHSVARLRHRKEH